MAELANELEHPVAEWDAYSNTRANYEPLVPDEFKQGPGGVTELYRDIRSLFVPEEGEPTPSEKSVEKAFELLGGVAYCMMIQRQKTGDRSWSFPKGYAATDDDRGIRIEWWHNRTHCVALSINDDASRMSAFVKLGIGDSGHTFRKVYPNWLATRIRELTKTSMSQG